MTGSENTKSSSRRITESGSRTHRLTQSTDIPSSSSTAPANNPTTVNHSTLHPFTLMNASNNAFFPGQLPNSPHTMNPSVMSGNNSFAGIPTSQPLPSQYQQQLTMWPFIPQLPFEVPLAAGPSAFVNSQPTTHSYSPTTGGPSRPTLHHVSPVPTTPQIHSPTSSTQESPIDPEEAAVVEDKRRRNTAASARFRIKKKQKNLNLERTVSDLTSRAEELEREATNLRRENSWLKEIVMMKGRRHLAGGGRPHENVSSESGGNDRGGDVAEGSDIEQGHEQGQRKKSSNAQIKGESKTNIDDIGNNKSKGKGR